jgi:hypothetical protein
MVDPRRVCVAWPNGRTAPGDGGSMNLSDLMTALEAHPGSILAWEVDQVGRSALSVFQIEGGTRQLAHIVVDDADAPAVRAELAATGQGAGSYGRRTGVVWLLRDGTFSVWGSEGLLFRSDGKSLEMKGESFAFEPTMEVIAFLDENLIGRGVKIANGAEEHLVARHLELRAAADFTYGPLDALDDCGWTVYLGRALATFLGVPLVDRTS